MPLIYIDSLESKKIYTITTSCKRRTPFIAFFKSPKNTFRSNKCNQGYFCTYINEYYANHFPFQMYCYSCNCQTTNEYETSILLSTCKSLCTLFYCLSIYWVRSHVNVVEVGCLEATSALFICLQVVLAVELNKINLFVWKISNFSLS